MSSAEKGQVTPEIYEQVCALYYELSELGPREQRERLAGLDVSPVVLRELESLLSIEVPSEEVADDELGGLGRHLIERHARESGLEEAPRFLGGFQLVRRIGEGGMGVVYEARRDESAAPVAVKVVRPDFVQSGLEGRLRREGRLLRKLRHPGIAAFLDAGEAPMEYAGGTVDVPFLAMELVDGVSLREFVELASLDEAQRVELVARVCDALQHAHDQGVVHRDLKPSNVLVVAVPGDPIGQPKVLDFGVARLLDHERHSLTATHTGALLGTLAYMSPEQSAGSTEELDGRCDVYALGVIAFELLMGSRPYDLSNDSIPEAVRRIQQEEPDWGGLHTAGPRRRLQWILGKGLEKDPARRYATPAAFASDLRAYSAGQLIEARPWTTARRVESWARRHPFRAASGLVAAVALVVTSFLWWRATESRETAEFNRAVAVEQTTLTESRTELLTRERDFVLRLADLTVLDDLVAQELELWPAHPRKLPDFEAWIRDAEQLIAQLEMCTEFTLELGQPEARTKFGLTDTEIEWWREAMDELVDGIRRLAEPEAGLFQRVVERRDLAARLERFSVEESGEAWEEAIGIVAADERFEDFELEPQIGLIPLGADADSGLVEFWLVASGAAPERDAMSGELRVEEETGIVLILLPGGPFLMGATQDRSDPNYDPWAKARDGPVHEVWLSPFFLSKYELTIGQYVRAGLSSPIAGESVGESFGTKIDDTAPVGLVNWHQARLCAERFGLELPTEAQWEYASRAGSSGGWYCELDELYLHENLADQDSLTAFPDGKFYHYEAWRDGFVIFGPVGSLRANPFGLHDMLGNVHEWCLDLYGEEYYAFSPLDDPWLDEETADDPDDRPRSLRGGSYRKDSRWGRSSYRTNLPAHSVTTRDVGVRLMRFVD